MCGPHQVWPLRSECWGRGVPTKVVCAECMKMCCLGGKNSVVKGLNDETEGSTGFRAPRKLYTCRHPRAKRKGVYRFPRGSKSRRPCGFHRLRYLYYTAGSQSNRCLY